MKIPASIVSYLVFVILLAILPIAAQHNGYDDWLIPHFWLFFLYISGLTLLAFGVVLWVQQKNSEYYVQAFMAGTTVKILACLIFIVVYLMKNKINKYVFVADFFYIYLLNMAFEIYVLLRNLRHKNLR